MRKQETFGEFVIRMAKESFAESARQTIQENKRKKRQEKENGFPNRH